ncbi:MAG: hypothetical protein ACE37F_02240 [Nannocystaceae bacterium]|nr:hypothetical protein [bacterium]
MDDASPEHDDDDREQSADYRHDALGELMTGAYAATSMVAMTVQGGDANLPAPPSWAIGDEAPKAEALDRASGMPAQIDSGRHSAVEEEIDLDLDDDLDDTPVLEVREDIGSGPVLEQPKISLRDAIEELPASSDELAAEIMDDDVPLDPSEDDEPEPAAAISTDSGVVVTPQHAVGAKLTGAYGAIPSHLRSPAPRERSPMPWILGGLAVALAVGAGIFISTRAPAEDATDAMAPASVVPDEGREEVELPTPPQPEPSAEAPAADGPPKAVAQDAYSVAAAKYERDSSNDALLEMTLAACTLQRGPDARAAFRKLVGSKARSKAVLGCRDEGVDVSAKVEGFTAGELAAQAQAALDAGNAEKALELAKQSNKTERNQPALQLVVTAHCQLGQASSAKKMMRHISKRNRRALIEACAEHGVRLR